MLMMVILGAALAAPEPEPVAAAEAQYKSYKSYVPAIYEPKYPSYKPEYPMGYKSSSSPYQPEYPKPSSSYPTPSPYTKKDYYCDPRSPPKCVYSANATFCLKDYEYPEQEIQVKSIIILCIHQSIKAGYL